MDFSWITVSILPSLTVGVFIALFNRAQKRRDERTEKRAEARKKESLLGLEMQFAASKLSLAAAIAVRDGKTNGELKDGIEAHDAAKKKYIAFLNEQATDHIYN